MKFSVLSSDFFSRFSSEFFSGPAFVCKPALQGSGGPNPLHCLAATATPPFQSGVGLVGKKDVSPLLTGKSKMHFIRKLALFALSCTMLMTSCATAQELAARNNDPAGTDAKESMESQALLDASDTYASEQEKLLEKEIQEELKKKKKKSKSKKSKEKDKVTLIEEEVAAMKSGEETQNGVRRKELELPGIEHELSQKFLRQYLTASGQKVLVRSLENAAPYLPYILEQLKERNMPLILQYLPIVESNYIPNAVSRSGATGIWQFMANSMAPYLEKDSWYDERRDPWKSTDAALSKLEYNFRFFGDWELALAAYNCGAGAMGKFVKQNPGKDFWYLAENEILKKESILYVPKLIAIADIIENAHYYGATGIEEAVKAIENVEPEKFTYIKTAGMFSFNQISKATGVSKARVKTLNPALFRNCTPAREVYSLRLPGDMPEDTEENLKKQGVATDAVMYTVKEGDSLWGISRRYGITVEDLCSVNEISEKKVLSIGKKLIVPIFN
ncbi:MAG: transglycosylase SLT domain-containing protein [Treponema sp.]|nr:transglycosylase SLT domain-containing protein [Treponema sp.]